jgi:hypothetical protein
VRSTASETIAQSTDPALKLKEKAEMEKQLRKFIGAAILITAAAASGQIFHQVQVTVPFSFMAGGKSSPAGITKWKLTGAAT